MEIVSDFQPGQIVYLEHGDRRLYAEVIQVVLSRQLCWVRPLLLVACSSEPHITNDLREASDLLWPLNLFHPALDTEVISILSEVLAKEAKPGIDTIAKQQLNQFIYQVWYAYKKD
ncbi:hypothetical protein ACF3DV_08775 [Chlorogloeopsis fritschii PCC 9212]|jgi:hypothetical protein|uniref:Uncharacterized protein n=1 Tax=Chlorogloeopsis fritschii PCC 6912 TaxID=211165 RepID=A0A3S0Y0J6_CHLFR|nr:hypothetical protein [Chlorogloeopsis fritschii]MBF2003965.1 hypothetical protein [Chlorogloeopsis fritschii C42_A2020_084]RUR85182.1 hypothetical protein PCC6912_12980 [Chlorogloeopsis fritschii PCC 6912]